MTPRDIHEEDFGRRRIFDSPGMYLFTFCLFAIVALAKLFKIGKDAAHLAGPPSSVQRDIGILGTLCLAIYLPILLRRLPNRVERLGITLFEISCFLWLANFLVEVGARWAEIPYKDRLQTIIVCSVAIVAGVRWVQVGRTPGRLMSNEADR